MPHAITALLEVGSEDRDREDEGGEEGEADEEPDKPVATPSLPYSTSLLLCSSILNLMYVEGSLDK